MGKEEEANGNVDIQNGGPVEKPQEATRDTWSGKLDFLMSTLSFAVGMGNLWRFPYLCYKDGGGAFLIPYVIMVIVIGFPLLYLEFVFGQYGRSGIVSIWKACPIFTGIGWSMFSLSLVVAIYYNVLISWCFYYIFSSFAKELPWRRCGNWWNTEHCAENIHSISSEINVTLSNYTSGLDLSTSINTSTAALVSTHLKSPSDEYFHHQMLALSSGLGDLGWPRWQLALCLLFVWVLLAVCLSRGIQSSGKVAYVTSMFPYVILLILFIRGLTLEGWTQGVYYYLVPQWDKLLDPRVWGDAAVQVFFSLSVCWGGQITLASYNNFHHNSFRDAIVIAAGDTLTSIFGGFVIFSYIGYMATSLNVPIEDVATQGAGLAFIVYPQAVTMLPVSQLWAILFMLMLVNVGLGTSFGIIQTLTATLQDMIPALNEGRRPLCLLLSLCLFLFLAGIVMTCNGGIFILQLLDNYAATYSIIFSGIALSLSLSWVYGWSRLSSNIKEMSGKTPSVFFRIMWQVVVPVLCIFILVLYISKYTRTFYGDYTLPIGAEIFGASICIMQIGLIPGIALYKVITCKEPGTFIERVRFMCQPDKDWGSYARQSEKQKQIEEMVPLKPVA